MDCSSSVKASKAATSMCTTMAPEHAEAKDVEWTLMARPLCESTNGLEPFLRCDVAFVLLAL